MSSGAGGNQKGGGGSAAPGNPKRARKRAPTRAAKRVPQAPAPVHPEFEVDLDAPADTRWAHVIDAFKYQLAAIVPAVEESLVGEWLAAQDTRSARLAHKGIAAVTHLTTMRLPYAPSPCPAVHRCPWRTRYSLCLATHCVDCGSWGRCVGTETKCVQWRRRSGCPCTKPCCCS